MLQEKKELDIIIPVYNEESCLDELIKRLIALRRKLNFLDMRLLFINDGSSDRSEEILYSYAEKNDCVKVINFSRNFGHQFAITAGLDYTDADYAAIMDSDLQDPPELIEEMYNKAKEGFDLVYGRRLTRGKEAVLKRVTACVFYKLINMMSYTKIPSCAGDFRLIRRNVLNTLKQMRERHRFIRGMVPWSGFKSASIAYHRDARYAGETKYTHKKMLLFALDAIFSFSNAPLRIATFLGLTVTALGFMGALLILYIRLFTDLSVPGISTVIVTVIILGGFQIIMLGIIGEYIGRIFEESKKRPLYVVKDTKNIGPT